MMIRFISSQSENVVYFVTLFFLFQLYLEDFHRFCKSVGGDTGTVMCELLVSHSPSIGDFCSSLSRTVPPSMHVVFVLLGSHKFGVRRMQSVDMLCVAICLRCMHPHGLFWERGSVDIGNRVSRLRKKADVGW